MLSLDKLKKNKVFVYLISGLVLVSFLSLVFTDNNNSYALVFKLYFVLFLIILGSFFLLNKFKAKITKQEGIIKIIDRLPLSQNASLFIIEKEAKNWFLGLSEQGITVLEVQDKQDFAEILQDIESK